MSKIADHLPEPGNHAYLKQNMYEKNTLKILTVFWKTVRFAPGLIVRKSSFSSYVKPPVKRHSRVFFSTERLQLIGLRLACSCASRTNRHWLPLDVDRV